MASPVPQIPIKTPVLMSNGLMSQAWVNWMITLYQRVGGGLAETNIELESSQSGSITEINAEILTLQNEAADQAHTISLLQSEADLLCLGPLP